MPIFLANVQFRYGYADLDRNSSGTPKSEKLIDRAPAAQTPAAAVLRAWFFSLQWPSFAKFFSIALTFALVAVGGCSSGDLRKQDDQPQPRVNMSEGAELFRPRSERTSNPFNTAATDVADPSAAGMGPGRDSTLPSAAVDVFGTRPERAGSADAQPLPTATVKAATEKGAEPAKGWTIVLAAFRGEASETTAQAALATFKQIPELREAFMEKRGEATIVGLGRFIQPAAGDAKESLERVHTLTLDGQRPFAGAILAPPEAVTLVGSLPEYNLALAKQTFGKQVLYTLQVGVYTSVDPKQRITAADVAEFRRKAEEAVVKLRQEGEAAFYYHSDDKSMVTIGLFGNEALARTEPLGLRQLRGRFPYNLYNGAGIRSRKAGQETIQPSLLVKIPER